jgi:cell division control protein 12
VEERGFKCRLTIIDTVGFGDFVINSGCWEPIVNYIDDQHAQYLEAESQAVRNAADDTRVHACLYFIQPSGHNLSVLDVQAMKELSTRVNLIPIIAKADSMLKTDMPSFKKRVMESLRFHEIPTFSCPVLEDDDVDTRNLVMEINVRCKMT